jgi:CSLREA domain-containing protein
MPISSIVQRLFLFLSLVTLLGNTAAKTTVADEAAQFFLPLVLTPLMVTTTQDELNNDGDCSLREAILAANTDTPVDACLVGAGRQVFLAPPGLYKLDLAGASEDGNVSGDLDISDDLVLIGAGATATILLGGGDRVLHVLTDTHVTVSHVTVAYGHTPDGAASSQSDRPGQDAAPGGGIANQGFFTLTHSLVLTNSTGAGGAGFEATITQTATAGGSGGLGGAFFNAGTAYISECFFANNTTGPGGLNPFGAGGGQGGAGGAIYNIGTLWITATTVTNNRTAAAMPSLVPPFFGGGNGADGGAIINEGTLRLAQSTIAANFAGSGGSGSFGSGLPGQGGGIFNQGTVEILSSITATNTNPAADRGVDCAGVLTSLGYNLVETTTGCTLAGVLTGNRVDVPAGLAPLGDNGGGLLTHALHSTSPAIDAGLCIDLAGQPVLIDERGVSRPQGPACDIGAFEAP